ncbi:RE1 [Symbiodinium sp. CCMP2592]|nr:RE1 [Symbiodinium sp. CCMP2592]
MTSLLGDGPCDDDGAAAPLDPWADAARAAHPPGEVDPPDGHGDDGGGSRRAWRKGKHSGDDAENAKGDPAVDRDNDEPQPSGKQPEERHDWNENSPWQSYDPTKHVWNGSWPEQSSWASTWSSGWNSGYNQGHSWSGNRGHSPGDGGAWEASWTRSSSATTSPWEAEWSNSHSANNSTGPWETEWTRSTSANTSNNPWETEWHRNAIPGGEWQSHQQSFDGNQSRAPSSDDGERRGTFSERMSVPTFSAENSGDELGQSARSYIRQIEAWVRVTRTPCAQQALLLYQNLKGRAWIEAEELEVAELCVPDGVERFKAWIAERYQEIEVGKIAEALNGFFRKLRRGPTQSVREFNATFDRAYARLVEIECKLPETARAWAYLSALSLSHSEELAILGSVNNEFVCTKLQRAAVLHEKSLRRPWDKDHPKPWERAKNNLKVNSANNAEPIPEEADEDLDAEDPLNPEEAELYEAFMTAKAQYRDAVKGRNLEPDEVKKAIENKILSAKQRSFCSVCKQRGHWYKDPECPGPPNGKPKGSPEPNKPQTANISNEVFMTSGPLSENLLAITDSACTKSVAGTSWLQRYVEVLKAFNIEVPLLGESDNFRFGASRIYSSNYAIVVSFKVGSSWVLVKVAIIHGDLPLLLSRSVLAELGMVYNLKEHKADFEAVRVSGHPLLSTPTGHPAISVHPGGQGIPLEAQPKMWDANKCVRGEVQILLDSAAYMADCSGGTGPYEAFVAVNALPESRPPQAQFPQIFYAKKIPPEVKNILISETLSVENFVKWWNGTRISSDFWIETQYSLIRIHVTPRKSLFSPVNWNTQQSLLRDNLLKVLGSVRETFSISCRSQRGLPLAVDFWNAMPADATNCHQCLWIGRTVFNRRPIAPIRTPPGLSGNVVSPNMADDQERELRSAITESKAIDKEEKGVPKGMSGMKLADLKMEADRIGVAYDSKVTRGTLMRHIRDYHETPDNTIMTIGRYKGSAYFQIPRQYAEWASREERENGINMSPDLKRFVLWYRRTSEEKEVKAGPSRREMMEEPERYAKIPYPGSASSRSWEEVSAMSQADKDQKPLTPSSFTAQTPPKASPTKRGAEKNATKERMHVDPPEQVLEEIRALEQRLAVLKDQDAVFSYHEGDEDNEEIWEELVGEDQDSFVLLSENVENFLSEAILKEDYSAETLASVLEATFGKNGEDFPNRGARARKKAMGEGDTGSCRISLGYYTYGNMRGICANTSKYASLCIYLKNYILAKQPDARWSSLSIAYNCSPRVHADFNNLRGTLNYITCAGDFTGGGGLWQENGHAKGDDIVLDPKGREIKGKVQPTSGTVVSFVPERFHSAQQWTAGDRWSVTAFSTRGFAGSTQGERRQLRFWGFPLHDLRHLSRDRKQIVNHLPSQRATPPPGGEGTDTTTFPSTSTTTSRPKKSMRKSLWRNASRASAFLTWSLSSLSLALASPTQEPLPAPAVALLEIGGIEQTLQATNDFGCYVAEPVPWNDVPQVDSGNYLITMLDQSRPSMLWINPAPPNRAFDEAKFFEVVDVCGRWQVQRYGSVVIPTDPLPEQSQQRVLRQLATFGSVSTVFLDNKQCFRATAIETVSNHMAEGDARDDQDERPLREGAAGITFDKKVPKDTAAALRRLHQNLGHPAREDLVRHLHLAGADKDVIKAAKSLSCSTCARTKGPKSARPAAEPKLLEFGDVVGVDMMYDYDIDGKKIKLFSIVDHASSYQVVVQVPQQTGTVLEKAFVKHWIQVFGAPKVITLDLERGIQDAFGRLADWFHIDLRTSAGQAHWQSGFTERHGKWWKEIFARVVQDQTVRGDEVEEAIAATSTAKNELRRRCGWAPCQIVFGKNPRGDDDLRFEVEEGGGELLRTPDSAQQRREMIRNAAKLSFFRSRTEDKIRRGMSQRARVKPRDLDNGAMVLFWRKPANKKTGLWKGPGTIIGRQDNNYWVSHSGRCYLCAPEHLRKALPEELGGMFALRATKDDLLRLVERNYDDSAVFPGEDDAEIGDKDLFDAIMDLSEPEGEEGENETGDMELDNGDLPDERPPGPPREDLPRAVRKRFSTKRPEPYENPKEKENVNEAHMLKRATTKRGRDKQLEKEIPWNMIPEEKRQLFIDAEHKQWEEHLRLGALRPLDVTESAEKMKSGRVLSSRFAYRDKNLARRRTDPSVEWKAKSRLVVSGHTDPDIISGALRTDSPTVSRTAVMTLLQLAASQLDSNWGIAAGDVTAAFLNGEKLDRELYLRQPKHGLPGLHPDQLIKIEKGVFGLIDSPRKWWKKFKKDIQNLTIDLPDNKKGKFFASPLDPCVFQLVELDAEGKRGTGPPLCYAAVHVDDILLVGPRALRASVQEQLSKCFPVDEWEEDVFDFIGSHIETRHDGIFVSQSSYATNRLFEIYVDPKAPADALADPEQVADNRSLVGALSWLASQSRPDLACGVSMCQQLQARPTIEDIRFTNTMAKRALLHKDEGILLAKVPLDEMVVTVFHDAGWSNAPDSNADPVYFLYEEDERNGRITEGPWVNKARKTKKRNSSVASQLGTLVMVCGKDGVTSAGSPASILEWRSHACDRVCRSTFGAETMGCIEGFELGQYVRAMIDSFLSGKITRDSGKGIPILGVTDCRSLYDHMHRDGLPRTPSDRRLAIDIACLRQTLTEETADHDDARAPLVWVPTHLQRADILTKPKLASDWWPLSGRLSLPLKEGNVVLKQCKSEDRC